MEEQTQHAQTAAAHAFEELPLARTASRPVLAGQYRIYSDEKNFTLVAASSAADALRASGVMQVYKIERESLTKCTLIKPDFGGAIEGEKKPEEGAAPAEPPAN